MKYYIVTQREEFGRSADISQYQLFKDQIAFVIWNCTWIDEEDDSDRDVNVDCLDESRNDVEQTEEDESTDDEYIPHITHSVIFKCIGVSKEKWYQEILALSSQKLHNKEVVPVQLHKEPENKKDSKPIAFMCKVDTTWERIGYVVKEALDKVHEAMDHGKILTVQFDWVNYVPHYKNPGWYTGIKITRDGNGLKLYYVLLALLFYC